MVIFEGSEKKLEIIINSLNLREFPRSFWEEVVSKSKASILSDRRSSKIDAYLLSESSLFVWEDRLLMLTCGTTVLSEAALFLVEKLGVKNIDVLLFQRKNEHFSHLQNTTFYDDVKELRRQIDGRCLRFGPKHEHHNFIFHSLVPYNASSDDQTTEILMYDIQGEAKDFLLSPHQSKEKVREFFTFKELLPGFIFDDFVFDPCGYSLNAIKDSFYCTMHVTPQESSSYVSFETNLHLDDKTRSLFNQLIKKLEPLSFDTIVYNGDLETSLSADYKVKTRVADQLSIGFEVRYHHYYKESDKLESPYIF